MPAPTAPTKKRTPNAPSERYSTPYVSSASHDCATHDVPAAVNEKTSWCGMPWSRMYSPVRRCQKNELSDRLEIPTAQPKSAKTAEKTAPRPEPACGWCLGDRAQRARRKLDLRPRERGAPPPPLPLPARGAGPAARGPAPLLAGIPGSRPLRSWPQSEREIWMKAGPMITTKIDGKMQNTNGNSILTGAFCATS